MPAASTLDQLCDSVIKLSAETQGRPTDWRGERVSWVFAKFAATCISFLRLIPSSTFYTPAKNLLLWDLSSAASLCRNLIEAYYVLVYVGSDSPDQKNREFREALWEFHAAFERHEMLRIALPSSKRLPEAAAPLATCRKRLEQSQAFQNLSPGHQKKLLDGDSFRLPSNIELSRIAGISENYYRAQYKYCSTFAHSSPFSISQMSAFRAGSPEAEQVLQRLIGLATGYAALAIRDFTRMFPDWEPTLPPEVRDCILIWQDTFKWEKQS